MSAHLIRTATPHKNLCAAISILQAHILAADTTADPAGTFGAYYMPLCKLELVVQLLIAVLEPADDLAGKKTD